MKKKKKKIVKAWKKKKLNGKKITNWSYDLFYHRSVRKFFESGVLAMGRLGYMKRQYFFSHLKSEGLYPTPPFLTATLPAKYISLQIKIAKIPISKPYKRQIFWLRLLVTRIVSDNFSDKPGCNVSMLKSRITKSSDLRSPTRRILTSFLIFCSIHLI